MTPLLYFVIAAVVVALFVVALFWKPQPTKRAGSEAPSPPPASPVITVEYPGLTSEKLARRLALMAHGQVEGDTSLPYTMPTEETFPMPRNPKFEVYQDSKREWRWRLKAANGRIVAVGEGHTRKRDAERAARMVAETAGKAEVVEA